MTGFVLLLLLLCDTSRAQFGVYFTQQQDVFTSYSSWLLTITVDLSPYNNQMSIIANELQAFKVSLDTLRNTSHSMDEIDETRMLQEESVHKLFTHEFKQLQLTLQSIHMLSGHDPTRTKRSLLPFVGNVMSSLFGTATHSQLRDLKQYFQQMRHIQSKVIHVIKESVSILNTTHYDVVI